MGPLQVSNGTNPRPTAQVREVLVAGDLWVRLRQLPGTAGRLAGRPSTSRRLPAPAAGRLARPTGRVRPVRSRAPAAGRLAPGRKTIHSRVASGPRAGSSPNTRDESSHATRLLSVRVLFRVEWRVDLVWPLKGPGVRQRSLVTGQQLPTVGLGGTRPPGRGSGLQFVILRKLVLADQLGGAVSIVRSDEPRRRRARLARARYRPTAAPPHRSRRRHRCRRPSQLCARTGRRGP